jgi:predicted alternative tryptophan synthase beta-subunit
MYKDVHAYSMEPDQIILPPEEIPRKWYNIVPEIPGGLPPPKEPQRFLDLRREKRKPSFAGLALDGTRKSYCILGCSIREV